MSWYKLVDRKPVAVTLAEHLAQARTHEDFEREYRVGRFVGEGTGEVSTVFLGLDHGHGRAGPPVLFESMIFGGPLDGEMRRYTTWEDAERGHTELVARVIFAAAAARGDLTR